MAKFLKSIFTTEKKKPQLECEGDGDRDDFTPPLDERRKLSISRSGRMKQANKKRYELSPELYGETNQYEKPKNMEYHVHRPIETDPTRQSSLDRHSRKEEKGKDEKVKEKEKEEKEKEKKEKEDKKEIINNRRSSGEKTPEEEIENAFEIIDKVS